MRKGKLQFMSPEQIMDSEGLDHRTDVWAAGAVLWNALTGKNLFKGESDAATMRNILEKAVTPPSTEGLKPPSCFDTIILRALSRDPAERYSTALEMADALRLTAAGNGLAGTKHQIARWVTETFGEELDSRRQAIREISQRRGDAPDHGDASQVNVVPPAVSSLRPLGASGAITLTQLSHLPSFSIEPSSPGSTPAPPLQRTPSEPPDFRQRRTRLWLGLALVGVTLVVIVALAFRSPSEETSSTSREIRPATSSETPPPANEQGPSVAPRVAPANAAVDTEQTPSARAAEDKPGRSAPRRAPLPPAPVNPPPREPKSEPRATAVPAPKPAPQPAPTDDFEKNPYLRR
jgi:serine/threonine-protein kinase